MFRVIVLGFIQGVAEWLPVSSEGMILLAEEYWFGGVDSLEAILGLALWLHLGTALAATVYFRKKILKLFRIAYNVLRIREEKKLADRSVLWFLVVSTLVSGVLGMGILVGLSEVFEAVLGQWAGVVNVLVGMLLLVTGGLQLRAKTGGERQEKDLKWIDGVLLGVLQGLAVVPGLSRSGLTVSGLLLRGVDKELALRLSFLMGIPLIIGGNVVLGLVSTFSAFAGATSDKAIFEVSEASFVSSIFNLESLVALLVAFGVGYVTIDWLLKLARRMNFGWFVVGMGLLVIGSR